MNSQPKLSQSSQQDPPPQVVVPVVANAPTRTLPRTLARQTVCVIERESV